MNVSKRTPRTDLQKSALLNRLSPPANGSKATPKRSFVEELAEDLGVDETVAWIGLDTFLDFSIRVTFDPGEIDFEQVAMTDSAAEIRAKFLAYLDSESAGARDRASLALLQMDAPRERATGPVAPDEADEKN